MRRSLVALAERFVSAEPKLERQELWCHDCEKYVQFDVDLCDCCRSEIARRGLVLASHVDDEPAAERAPAIVYFIGGDTGPIKIGVSKLPAGRLKELQTSHPVKLSILAVRDGGRRQEREYHARFSEHRLTGEWFERHPDILAEIDRIRSAAA